MVIPYPLQQQLPFSQRDFLLNPDQIGLYLGLDISESMVNMGNSIYSKNRNMKFAKADLSKEYPFLDEEPFDIYLSTYSSPSHLTELELKNLVEKIFNHTSGKSYLVLDLFGKFSPEWPCYWHNSDKEMLPYNMSWLHLPAVLNANDVEEYFVKFWDSESLIKMLNDSAAKLNKEKGKTIDDYFSRLDSLGYLSDLEFAKWFVESRNKSRPRSVRALSYELYHKGISKEIISQVLQELGSDKSALELIIEKKQHLPPDKLMAYLARQGFPYELIKKTLASRLK